MSKQSVEYKALARSPKAMMEFQLRGKMPNAVNPSSPLITYLEGISPRDRIAMKNVKLSPALGYQSGASFANAQMLLTYLKPKEWIAHKSWPAESMRLKSFNRRITDELFQQSQTK